LSYYYYYYHHRLIIIIINLSVCFYYITVSAVNKDKYYSSEHTMGQRVMGHGSWVKWVSKCEWVTWVTGQNRT